MNRNWKCCRMDWRNKNLAANKNASPRWITNFPPFQQRRNLQKKKPKLKSDENNTLWTWHRLFIELENCFSRVGKLWLTATTTIAYNILDPLLPGNITDNSTVLPVGISDHCTLEIDTFLWPVKLILIERTRLDFRIHKARRKNASNPNLLGFLGSYIKDVFF